MNQRSFDVMSDIRSNDIFEVFGCYDRVFVFENGI
jgi:hypothetical protein